MSAVNDIIRLGKALEAAEQKVARADSLDQAIRESEMRLEGLRDAETQAVAVKMAAESQARYAKEHAENLAIGIETQARAETEALVADCKAWCESRRAEANEECRRLSEHAARMNKSVVTLADEEARLAQSVVKLREELASLRARIDV